MELSCELGNLEVGESKGRVEVESEDRVLVKRFIGC